MLYYYYYYYTTFSYMALEEQYRACDATGYSAILGLVGFIISCWKLRPLV